MSISRCRSSGTCSVFHTCIGTIAAKATSAAVTVLSGFPLGSTAISRSPQVSALTTIILPAI